MRLDFSHFSHLSRPWRVVSRTGQAKRLLCWEGDAASYTMSEVDSISITVGYLRYQRLSVIIQTPTSPIVRSSPQRLE
jgi:hypothetical protein